jgi:hypothetical protein
MLALMLSTGCLGWQKLPEQPPAPPPQRPAPPVTSEQVHAGNAQQMAETLKRELDREGK